MEGVVILRLSEGKYPYGSVLHPGGQHQCYYFPPIWGERGENFPPFLELEKNLPPIWGDENFPDFMVFSMFFIQNLVGNVEKRHFSGGACGGLSKRRI